MTIKICTFMGDTIMLNKPSVKDAIDHLATRGLAKSDIHSVYVGKKKITLS